MHESGDKHDFVKLLDDPFQEGPFPLSYDLSPLPLILLCDVHLLSRTFINAHVIIIKYLHHKWLNQSINLAFTFGVIAFFNAT